MNAVPPVYFHYDDVRFTFKNRTALKWFVYKLFKKEKKQLEKLNYVFCTDNALRALNKEFLGHHTLTDIITFPLSPHGIPIVADVYISIDLVAENAGLHYVSFKEELHQIIFHGALHLCGYDDKTKKSKGEMRRMEELCLSHYF